MILAMALSSRSFWTPSFQEERTEKRAKSGWLAGWWVFGVFGTAVIGKQLQLFACGFDQPKGSALLSLRLFFFFSLSLSHSHSLSLLSSSLPLLLVIQGWKSSSSLYLSFNLPPGYPSPISYSIVHLTLLSRPSNRPCTLFFFFY